MSESPNTDTADNTCLICDGPLAEHPDYDAIPHSRVTTTALTPQCGHTAHARCLQRWFLYRSPCPCPVCRQQVTSHGVGLRGLPDCVPSETAMRQRVSRLLSEYEHEETQDNVRRLFVLLQTYLDEDISAACREHFSGILKKYQNTVLPSGTVMPSDLAQPLEEYSSTKSGECLARLRQRVYEALISRKLEPACRDFLTFVLEEPSEAPKRQEVMDLTNEFNKADSVSEKNAIVRKIRERINQFLEGELSQGFQGRLLDILWQIPETSDIDKLAEVAKLTEKFNRTCSESERRALTQKIRERIHEYLKGELSEAAREHLLGILRQTPEPSEIDKLTEVTELADKFNKSASASEKNALARKIRERIDEYMEGDLSDGVREHLLGILRQTPEPSEIDKLTEVISLADSVNKASHSEEHGLARRLRTLINQYLEGDLSEGVREQFLDILRQLPEASDIDKLAEVTALTEQFNKSASASEKHALARKIRERINEYMDGSLSDGVREHFLGILRQTPEASDIDKVMEVFTLGDKFNKSASASEKNALAWKIRKRINEYMDGSLSGEVREYFLGILQQVPEASDIDKLTEVTDLADKFNKPASASEKHALARKIRKRINGYMEGDLSDGVHEHFLGILRQTPDADAPDYDKYEEVAALVDTCNQAPVVRRLSIAPRIRESIHKYLKSELSAPVRDRFLHILHQVPNPFEDKGSVHEILLHYDEYRGKSNQAARRRLREFVQKKIRENPAIRDDVVVTSVLKILDAHSAEEQGTGTRARPDVPTPMEAHCSEEQMDTGALTEPREPAHIHASVYERHSTMRKIAGLVVS